MIFNTSSDKVEPEESEIVYSLIEHSFAKMNEF